MNRAWTLEELAAWCVKQAYAERSNALQALGEAWGWLQSRDLITWNPDQTKEVLGMLVRGVYIPERSRPASHDAWPYTIPCVAELANKGLRFSSPITFLVGENGSRKSTIIEALAEAFKFDDRGGRNLGQYANNRFKSTLGSAIQLDLTSKGAAVLRGPRSKRRGFFLRAETAMGLLEVKSGTHGYWEEDLAQASHGEGFLTVFATMFQEPLLYLMDEPEAALSFTSCLRLVGLMHQLGQTGAQVICATHSPILASTPGADIIEVGEHGSRRVEWKELELVDHWRRYMENPGLLPFPWVGFHDCLGELGVAVVGVGVVVVVNVSGVVVVVGVVGRWIFGLACWGWCGIPSTWRSPTTRHPEGSIPRYRQRIW